MDSYQKIIHCYDDEKRVKLVRNHLDSIFKNKETIRKLWFKITLALLRDEITNVEFRQKMSELSKLRKVYA